MENKELKFIMLCGLSGSGKSAYAKKISRKFNAVHIASDNIRQAVYGDQRIQDNPSFVFETCQKAAIVNLNNGRSVVFDATNLRFKNRINILDAVKKEVKDVNVTYECHVIVKPIHKCYDDDLDREYNVGKNVIDKQVRQFQIPFYEEGWDDIKLIGENNADFSFSNMENTMSKLRVMGRGFDQHTPYHSFTLGEHCDMVANYVAEKVNLAKTEHMILHSASYVHDYGKLFGHTVDENGIWHYYGHAEIGAYALLCDMMYEPFYTTSIIKFNEKEMTYEQKRPILNSVFYVNYHMIPFDLTSEKNKRKYEKIFGTEKFNNLMLLHEADINGKQLEKEVKA